MTADPTSHLAEPPGEWDFDELYRSEYARMVALARLMAGELAVAEEIVQDAYVQLYRTWSSVQYPLTYLRIAVVNGCRSHGRRRTVERRHRSPPRESVVIDTTATAIRDALELLTPRQRAAIVLRYFEDLPERDIAHALGCRPGTVKSLLSRDAMRSAPWFAPNPQERNSLSMDSTGAGSTPTAAAAPVVTTMPTAMPVTIFGQRRLCA